MSPKRTTGRPAAYWRLQPIRFGLNPRQGHARLDAALHLHERELHVHGGREVGLIDSELLELDDLARLRRAAARRAIGHEEMDSNGRRSA